MSISLSPIQHAALKELVTAGEFIHTRSGWSSPESENVYQDGTMQGLANERLAYLQWRGRSHGKARPTDMGRRFLAGETERECRAKGIITVTAA